MLGQSILYSDLGRAWWSGDDEPQTELLVRARRLAALVAERTARSGRVVLSCRHARSFVPGLLGAWAAGATVELLPNVQPGTLDRVDADAEVTCVLHDDVASRARSPKAIYVPDAAAGFGEGMHDGAPPRIAVRMTTSGTTERPTRVEKTFAQLVGEVDVLARVFGPAAVVMSTVPFSHLYGLLFGVLLPLRLGARIVDHDALLPADVATVLRREAADVVISTPAHLRAMASAPMPPGLRVISSGAPLAHELQLRLAVEHGWRVTDVLGSTETGGIATRPHPTSPWLPLPGVALEVDDDRLSVRSPWCPGVTLDDRVELAADGTFRYLGRDRELIKIAGKRAEAAAIEAAVLALPEVRDAAVLVHGATGKEPRLHLAVVARGDAAPPREALAAAIRREFDAVFVPRVIRVVAAIPRTERGKVDTAALRELLGVRATSTTAIPLRRTGAGTYVASIPEDLVFFAGHFEGFALLPGAAIVERLVWPATRAELPAVRALRAIRRLRFKRPILPGQKLTLTLRDEARSVWFELASAAGQVASGQLVVE